ncbi:hypothetical protein EVAR_91050_1 [Eumeta japonica]|uniref:Uncharacterized protein n=1 Tax=Eumeta variegata TaxID=151549 RepID=A0A4C1Z9P9_EUMVA|nr:hypothetical protein EVAR_91050_1 [Eumeta japonica]
MTALLVIAGKGDVTDAKSLLLISPNGLFSYSSAFAFRVCSRTALNLKADNVFIDVPGLSRLKKLYLFVDSPVGYSVSRVRPTAGYRTGIRSGNLITTNCS